MKSRIKKAETELKNIANMKKDLQRYIDCAWKSTLMKSCELVELVWKKELKRLKAEESLKVQGKAKAGDAKKVAARKNKFEGLSHNELEEIAFSIYTPDNIAQLALAQLINAA